MATEWKRPRRGSILGPDAASAKYHQVGNVQHSSDFPDFGDSDDALRFRWQRGRRFESGRGLSDLACPQDVQVEQLEFVPRDPVDHLPCAERPVEIDVMRHVAGVARRADE